MSLFEYKAINQKGEIVVNTVQATNREEAASNLSASGLKVLTIKNVDKNPPVLFQRRISLSDKANFCRFTSMMIRSGLSIPEAADLIRQETENNKFKKILSDIAYETSRGTSLSSILSRYKEDFDTVFITIVKVGEESGNLEKSFEYLSEQLSATYESNQKIKGSLMYPAVVLSATAVIGLITIIGVLPKISSVFLKMNIKIPAATKAVLNFGNFIGLHTPLVLAISILSLILSILFVTLQPSRNILLLIFSKIPAIRKIMIQTDVALFARTLSTLIKSGVPIVSALDVSADTLKVPELKKTAQNFGSHVAKGESLSEVLLKSRGIFPLIMVQTVRAGEKSGMLEKVLVELADFYEKDSQASIKKFTTLLEPILMLIIGVIVGAMVILIIAPIYSIVGSLQQSIQAPR